MRRTGVSVLVLVFLFGFIAFAQSVYAGTMYATDDITDNLYTINTTTGAATLVGPTGQDLSLSGLAYDTANSTMYVSDVSLPTDGYGLGSVNLATGAVAIIGSHVISNDIMGLAFIGNTLYGSDADNDSLDTINLATGAATIVGPFVNQDSNGMKCLAYDSETNTLYGMGNTNVYTIDPMTGTATLVGPLGVTFGNYVGCEVDSSTGILYAGDDPAGNLYSVNKTTGTATLVGPTGIQISGLAYVPSKATSVPTMNEWGMIIFLIAAGFGSVYYLRRLKIKEN